MTAITSAASPAPMPLLKHASMAPGLKSRPSPAAEDRRVHRPALLDPLSDRATLQLIRRTLCPQHTGDKARDAQVPIEQLLPPLTSRNDVDLQLYAFLAIIMREFVQAWYGKITTDETFVAEILHIIAHCTRALEQRFRKLDLESLVLDEIPDLLDRHATAYRAAQQPISQPPVDIDRRQIYHSLCPLPFLSPVPRLDDPVTVSEQQENEAVYRQLLVQAVLAILLPTEDLENPCLTALVGQIFSELIIGNVIANKASQPWLLYEGICITARVLDEKKTRAAARIVSGAHGQSNFGLAARKHRSWSVQGFFVSLIHVAIIITTAIRFLVGIVSEFMSLPPRAMFTPEKGHGDATVNSNNPDQQPSNDASPQIKAPVLTFKLWSSFGKLAEMDLRMPWLWGFASLLQTAAVHGPGHLAGLDGPFDRLLSYHLQSLFDPSHLPPILRSLRGSLFPNNSPGQSTLAAPSSDEELRALRRRAASALWGLLPRGVGRVYFGGHLWRRGGGGGLGDGSSNSEGVEEQERMLDELDSLLSVVEDEYCNKHLLYSVLELLLVRLMPELSEKGVVELWEERLG